MKSFVVCLLVALSLLVGSFAHAGGGGCGEEDCPEGPQTYPIAECRTSKVDSVDQALAAVNPTVRKLVTAIGQSGMRLVLIGEPQRIHSASLQTKAFEGAWSLAAYGDPEPFSAQAPFAFRTRQFYRVAWSIGDRDPRPLIDSLIFQVVQNPGSPMARMRVVALVMDDKANPWTIHEHELLLATLECRPVSKTAAQAAHDGQ